MDGKVWVTSDLHFGHKNILKYSQDTRSQFGSTVDEMDLGMITAWNKLIAANDSIFILGDISFHKLTRTLEILDELNGKKTLIVGNHDAKAIQSKEFISKFQEVHYYLEIKVEQTKVVMMHFPIAEWNMKRYGAVHLFGHCHGGNPGFAEPHCRALDVGIDATGLIASGLHEMVNKAKAAPALDNRYANGTNS